MKINLFSFIIFSLNIFVTSNFFYPRALILDIVVKTNPTFKFPKHEGIVASDGKDTDTLPEVPLSIPTQRPEEDPCLPSPCGPGFRCQVIKGQARCTYVPNYIGVLPRYPPECTIDSECNADMACINNRCSNACPGICGKNALCSVNNHMPYCSCLPGFSGNPFVSCDIIHQDADIVNPTPCSPSLCGPYSQCRQVNSQAICSCQIDFMGTPPNCRPECTMNNECANDKACLHYKCVDPCVYQCARNANCRVIAHDSLCSCQDGFTGDPFTKCLPIPLLTSTPQPEQDPCMPLPSGQNSQCQEFSSQARRTYLPSKGFLPECRSKCSINSECNAVMACINNWRSDSCFGFCGQNAQCIVNDEIPFCYCLPGYTGNPFINCYLIDAALDQTFGFTQYPELDMEPRPKQTGDYYKYLNPYLSSLEVLECPAGFVKHKGICIQEHFY